MLRTRAAGGKLKSEEQVMRWAMIVAGVFAATLSLAAFHSSGQTPEAKKPIQDFSPLTPGPSPARGEGRNETASRPAQGSLRVGTFDSRAVAVAYARSAATQPLMKELVEQYNRAKAAGNQAEMNRLQAEGKSRQDRLHQQVFSTASVADILETIKDQLPAIAKQANVDLIVSKWDSVYLAPGAEPVDLTDLMIKPFKPDQKVLTIVEQLRKQTPVPLGKLKMDTHE
jgi:hypothetical protein